LDSVSSAGKYGRRSETGASPRGRAGKNRQTIFLLKGRVVVEKINALIEKYREQAVAYRRHMHMYPEPSLEERETAKFIADSRRAMGLEPQENIGGYGVVAVIQGSRPGKCVGLRADFDALPIQERTGLPFASKNEGVCHACGHDMHAGMLLGCAHVLNELRDDFAGCVKLIFQPAEEWVLCGGAIDMIRDGVMENPHIDGIFAQHVSVEQTVGEATICDGRDSSSTDRLFITVKGKSCHGARPNNGIDGIVIAAKVIDAIQTIVSRNVDPLEPVVVTFGKIEGGERYDILAREVRLEGTYRTHNVYWRENVPVYVERIVKGVTEAMGGSYEFEYKPGYPPLTNDHEMFKLVYGVMQEELGDKAYISKTPKMGGEDFAFFCERVPGARFDLGCRTPGINFGEAEPLHSGAFNPDEGCIPVGMNLMLRSALRFLSE
jgi:amidohydrolase